MARSCPAESRLRLVALAAFLPLLGACSDLENAGCPRDGHTAFESRAPFDARARVRRVDCGFRSGVEGMAVGADGSIWLRRLEYTDRGDESFYYPAEKRLTHVGPGGELLGELPMPEFIKDFVVHPSGELTILGWDQPEDPRTLQMRRIRPDGSVIAERLLSFSIPPAERLYYLSSADGQLARVTLPEEERVLGVAAARAHGEDLFVLVGADGLRLLHLDSTLATRWVSVVAPSVGILGASWDQLRALGAPFIGWALAVDEAGRIHVASPFLDITRRAYADALETQPEGPGGRGILLTTFEPTGARLSARTVPTETADDITSLIVRGDTFTIGARAATPATQAKKRIDTDLFFASGRWDGMGDAPVIRTIALDRDEAPTALVPCGEGRYCFAGHTGYVEMETGLTHDAGKGFILTVDAKGEQQDLLLLEGQRDTEVLRALPRPDGSIVFAFATNQPANTRVGDRFKNNEVWLGVFGGP
ncbi:hypothetical protein [Pyxidicoccus xibeiensis]|uniref:hypothetical protein n=1 Tax=Pyxidicoccus xibeiensis TaxID=2906759 RepID=UPI0020A7FB13|nr:hypothetical protein [Pyxidicoccus xibeiensis]MCP3138041.1 hypothetical protein [Pyxidicoccus xibeiensis]